MNIEKEIEAHEELAAEAMGLVPVEPEYGGDLVRDEIVNPLTGELVPRADIPAVAVALDQIRFRRDQLNVAIGVFTDPLLAESRRLGTKTLIAGNLRLEVSADSEIEWDVTKLVDLLELGLPVERYNELVKETVTYKVNASVARQIAGASTEYAAVIEAAKTRVPKRQYVSVKP